MEKKFGKKRSDWKRRKNLQSEPICVSQNRCVLYFPRVIILQAMFETGKKLHTMYFETQWAKIR